MVDGEIHIRLLLVLNPQPLDSSRVFSSKHELKASHCTRGESLETFLCQGNEAGNGVETMEDLSCQDADYCDYSP